MSDKERYERLRDVADDDRWDIPPAIRALLREAADEIERKNAALSETNTVLGAIRDMVCPRP